MARGVAIHPESDGVESFLRDDGEIRALGEGATDKAIGIFITTAFGGTVGMGDVVDGTSFVGEASQTHLREGSSGGNALMAYIIVYAHQES